jgi:hypothetical protein
MNKLKNEEKEAFLTQKCLHSRERERVCEPKHKSAETIIYRLCGREQLVDSPNNKWMEKTT